MVFTKRKDKVEEEIKEEAPVAPEPKVEEQPKERYSLTQIPTEHTVGIVDNEKGEVMDTAYATVKIMNDIELIKEALIQ